MHVILLAGGKGTRLWPLSRKGLPKHLIALGNAGSLFQETVKRALPLLSKDDIIVVVTNEEQERLLKSQLSQLGIPDSKVLFLLEKVGRNTGPAVTWAVVELLKRFSSGVAVMLPCDHQIGDVSLFQEQVVKAGQLAECKGKMVLLGIFPSYPSTGYGYIQIEEDNAIDWKGERFYVVQGFKEKPDKDTAGTYLKSGKFLWNSGMLVFPLETFYSNAKEIMPEIIEPLERSENIALIYSSLPSISIDYAMLERISGLVCLPAKFRWSDLGTWLAVYEMGEKDGDGNVRLADMIGLNVKNSLVIGQPNKKIGLIGLSDMVVVDTHDSLLICPMDKVQEVKKIVQILEEGGEISWRDPAKVERPWGYYVVLDRGPRFKTKRIVIYPGKSLSLQRHQHRSEHWVVLQGVARVRRGKDEFEVHPNESTYIPVGVIHKLSNPGKIPLEIIEVQNGEYLEEDDIERFDE